jgi:hypothetical protein
LNREFNRQHAGHARRETPCRRRSRTHSLGLNWHLRRRVDLTEVPNLFCTFDLLIPGQFRRMDIKLSLRSLRSWLSTQYQVRFSIKGARIPRRRSSDIPGSPRRLLSSQAYRKV